MSLEKAELKMLMLQDLGNKFDDVLEEMGRDQCRTEGASKALSQAATVIAQLATLVDDDLDKERYDIETATRIKQYISRATTQVSDMASAMTRNKLVAQGRREGIAQVVQMTKKEYDREEAKKKAIEKASEDPSLIAQDGLSRRLTGVHPGPTIKQRRLADSAPESEAKTKAKSVSKSANGKVKRTRRSKVPKKPRPEKAS